MGLILGIIWSPTPMNCEVQGIIFCSGPFLSFVTAKIQSLSNTFNGKLELNIEFLLCGPMLSFKIAWSSLDFCNFDQQYFSEVLYLTKLWFLKPNDTKSQEKWKMDEINEIVPIQCSTWFSSWHELTKQSQKNLKYLKL